MLCTLDELMALWEEPSVCFAHMGLQSVFCLGEGREGLCVPNQNTIFEEDRQCRQNREIINNTKTK